MIIGLGHKRRVGKDTVADRLVAAHGFRRAAFADVLKDAARCIFGFTDAQLYGADKDEPDPFWGFSPRGALQELGTRGVRETIGPNTWVRAMERRFQRGDLRGDVVVTDVRFPNEAEMIRRLDGYLVHVVRPSLGASDAHASEVALDGFDGWSLVLRNDGTVGELHAAVDLALSHLRVRHV